MADHISTPKGPRRNATQQLSDAQWQRKLGTTETAQQAKYKYPR